MWCAILINNLWYLLHISGGVFLQGPWSLMNLNKITNFILPFSEEEIRCVFDDN